MNIQYRVGMGSNTPSCEAPRGEAPQTPFPSAPVQGPRGSPCRASPAAGAFPGRRLPSLYGTRRDVPGANLLNTVIRTPEGEIFGGVKMLNLKGNNKAEEIISGGISAFQEGGVVHGR